MRWLVVDPQLPWDHSGKTERKFQFILLLLVVLSVVFAFIISQVILPPKQRVKAEIPDRIVKMILDQKKKVIPPPPPPEPEPEPEPEEKKPEEKKPEPEVKKVPEEIKPEPEPEPDREEAREIAEQHLAVFDVLADLRDEPSIDKIDSERQLSLGEAKAQVVERDMITNSARKSSGGVRVGTASSGIAGTGLSGGGSQTVRSNLAAAKEKQNRLSASGKAQRPSENIEQHMDSSKSSFFALYNRALRSNPGMQGEVIFRISILPSGRVSKVVIISSGLNDKKLERKLMARIRLIKFGKMSVETWTDNYRMTFLPS